MGNITAPVLVFGATGTQGAAVLAELRSRGIPVRAVVTRPESVAKLQQEGVETVIADLGNREAVRDALQGVYGVYYVIPVLGALESARYTENVLVEAAAAGVKHLVFEPRGSFPDQPTDVGMIEGTRALTHAVLNGPVPATVVRATVYLDNLLGPWAAAAIVNDGVFAYPVHPDQRSGWVGARDTARVVAAAFQDPGTAGKILDVVSADDPSGEEVARSLSQAVGREVRLVTLSAQQFGDALGAAFGIPEAGAEIAKMYELSLSHPRTERLPANPELSRLNAEPETSAEWAKHQPWSLFANATANA